MMKLDLEKEDYRYCPSNRIWTKPDYAGISYSDGEDEEVRLKAIIDQAVDLSVLSAELAGHCTDWSSLYHLSRKRANLLRPFDEQFRGKDILEVGAGCGAISRYLGESSANVTALEGSLRRAAIAASRCRDLNSVTVVAAPFHQVTAVKRFDVVTLIGVLEYARLFFPAETGDPIDAMLAHAIGFLKPGGRLIIAIENQLGLKYFAGFPEDHAGQPMFGIEEHYTHNSVVTFGRRDLGARVVCAGLSTHQWWYPFPDYKLPNLLVSETGAMPLAGFDLTPIIRSACTRDAQYPRYVSINQERAWRPVVRNGLLGDLANSFLLVASETQFSEMADELPLAIHFSTDRRPEFAKKVVFRSIGNGDFSATQHALRPVTGEGEASPLKQVLVDQQFIKGELWQDRLALIMSSPEWNIEQLQKWFQVWYEAFRACAAESTHENFILEEIDGRYFDAIPANMMIDAHGKAVFFDQEWCLNQRIKVKYVLIRALLTAFSSFCIIARPKVPIEVNVVSLVTRILECSGVTVTAEDYTSYIATESSIHELASGTCCQLDAESLSQWQLLEVATLERYGDIGRLNEKIHSLEMRCDNLEQWLRILQNSMSWKVTAPLRGGMSLLRSFREKLGSW